MQNDRTTRPEPSHGHTEALEAGEPGVGADRVLGDPDFGGMNVCDVPPSPASSAKPGRARQQKRSARHRVEDAIKRGELVRPAVCETCGSRPGRKRNGRSLIEAHHVDYSRPLDVQWLCQSCHLEVTLVPQRTKGHVVKPITERFDEKLEKHDSDCSCCSGCWFWTGYLTKDGHGRLRRGGRETSPIYVHRYSYERFIGPLLPGMQIRHLCGNSSCANPEHLTSAVAA